MGFVENEVLLEDVESLSPNGLFFPRNHDHERKGRIFFWARFEKKENGLFFYFWRGEEWTCF